jgi:endonuclease/exonuclease/phosphatase (EEP) superfamily protein YafD
LQTLLGVAASVLLILCAVIAGAGWLAFRFPAFDLINNVLPVWFASGIVAAIVLFACRGWTRILVAGSAIVAVSGFPPIMRDLFGSARVVVDRDRAGSAGMLKLVQFNALKDNQAPRAVAAWIRHEQPDVVTMEETLGSSRAILRLLRPLYPYQVSCLSRMRCSTVILSREAPSASGGLARGDPENRKTLSATWMRFDRNGHPVTVIAVHMMRPWPWGDQARGRLMLAAFLDTIDRKRTIIAGDFNTTPWAVAMRNQDRMIALPRYTHSPTWPAMIDGTATPPFLPIDHIYAGSDWQLTSLRRGPRLGSDHFPLVAILRLQDATGR